MEKYLNDETFNSLQELINLVKSSFEYKECIRLKEEMSKDKDLLELIGKVKKCQQDYVKSGYSDLKKEVLDENIKLLENNKTYVLYSYYLDKVNNYINDIISELNDYFFDITNILK